MERTPRRRWSEAEKEKRIATDPDRSVDRSASPKLMASAIRSQRSASVSVDRSPGRERSTGVAAGVRSGDDGEDNAADGTGSREVAPELMEKTRRRLTPFRLKEGGAVEQLVNLPSEISRPSVVVGQDWGDVLPTCSSFRSVLSLLRICKAFGVTFVIPRDDQRPWSAPRGYSCVYESFFEEDSRLWFPIPRLITSYCFRRGIALTQLMVGAVRIAVALMVMAAEIDVSMSDRTFEELTQIQPQPNGILTVQMRSGIHILTGHPSRAKKDWHRFYFYVKADEFAFEEPPSDSSQVLWSHHRVGHPNTAGPSDAFLGDVPKIIALDKQEWCSFDRKRIRRQRKRIAKGDWVSNLPCQANKGKRLGLPLMGKYPKVYLDYSEILGAQLDGEALEEATGSVEKSPEVLGSFAEGSGATGVEASVDEGFVLASGSRLSEQIKEKGEISKEAGSQSGAEKGLVVDVDRSSSDRETDGTREIPEKESVDGDPKGLAESAQPDLLRTKRKGATGGDSRELGSKKLKVGDERSSSSLQGAILLAPTNGPWKGLDPPSEKPPVAPSEHFSFSHSRDVLFANDLSACAELSSHIRGGIRLMPGVSELAFSNKFEESARADFLAIARKNQLILEYELALRKATVDLKKATAAIAVKDATINEYKKKASDATKELAAERVRFGRERKQASETAGNLEEELETSRTKVARLEEEKSKEAETTKKTIDRMKQTHRRDLMSERARIVAEAEIRFEKFKKYMDDRDKYEEKLLLHGQAAGTLRSMDVIKKWGISVPKKLTDLLTANEAKYKKEKEEVTVEIITEQDLSLPPPSFDQFGSNLNTVGPTTAALLRSPVLESDRNVTAPDVEVIDQPAPKGVDMRPSSVPEAPVQNVAETEVAERQSPRID